MPGDDDLARTLRGWAAESARQDRLRRRLEAELDAPVRRVPRLAEAPVGLDALAALLPQRAIDRVVGPSP